MTVIRISSRHRRALPVALLGGVAVLALAIRLLSALPIREAGYFDAYYYFHVGHNLAVGRGAVEDMIWNYLDQSPVAMQIPRPSHLYWMPLTSFLVAIGIRLFEPLFGEWRGALLPFVLMSALLPPFSSWIAYQLWGRRDWALSTGLLTIFSGFYFLYWVVPDNYTPFALAVGTALIGMWAALSGRAYGWFLAGIGAGFSHLARADGILLVATVAILATVHSLGSISSGVEGRGVDPGPGRTVANRRRLFLRAGALACAGYLLVLGPWLLRNLMVAGTILPGGGLKTVWLRSYDEIFSYQTELSPARLASWGVWPIVRSRVQALLWNSVIVLGTMQFFLAPFAWLGLKRALYAGRFPVLLRPVLLYGGILFLSMTLLFPFPSRRGSLLHSSAALIPWLMALVPAGIEVAAHRFARWRGQDPELAGRFFGTGFVALAAFVSLWLYLQAVYLPPAPGASLARWNERTEHYRAANDLLVANGATGPIMVVNPPAFTVSTGRPSIAIPTDNLAAITTVADRLGARWLIVEQDHAAPLRPVWQEAVPPAGWRHAVTVEDALGAPVHLFERVQP